MPTARAAAGPTIGEVPRGEHEEPGAGVLVARLAGVERARVPPKDLVASRVVGRQARRRRLLQRLGDRHAEGTGVGVVGHGWHRPVGRLPTVPVSDDRRGRGLRCSVVSLRRLATLACGVLVIVLGHALGGYGGAVVVGLGLGVVVVGLGRREPHLLRRRGAALPEDVPIEHDDEAGDRGRWSEW